MLHPTLYDYLRENDHHEYPADDYEPGTPVLNVTTGEVIVWPPAPEKMDIPTHDGVYFDESDPRFQFPY